MIAPSLADEATRAAALLAPFGISLLEAARMAVISKNAELSSSSIEDALTSFRKSKSKSNRSDAHAKAYEYMERDLLKSFAGRMLSSITGAELLVHAEKFAPSPASFNGLTRLISAFWRWSAKHPRDWCDANPSFLS